MNRSNFVYVTYIRTTPERLWSALTTTDFIRQYWFGMTIESAFTAGSPWQMSFEDGRIADHGEILEADPPRRLVIKWFDEWQPEFKAEGESRCTIEIEPVPDLGQNAVKLSITHSMERADSKFIQAVAGGWPSILANLKSLLETGEIVLHTSKRHE
ncbi:MAG: SRPBCC family protein [Proteobacteria bacterium]|nr:SRPBCC family protein [Pseudomonadota bacterium]